METSRKLAKYDRLYDQIKQYIQTTEDIWARLATMEAVLHHKMQSFFWTGVYVLVDGDLIVRSYQGPVACQKLRNGVFAGPRSTPGIRLSWITWKNFRGISLVMPPRKVRL